MQDLYAYCIEKIFMRQEKNMGIKRIKSENGLNICHNKGGVNILSLEGNIARYIRKKGIQLTVMSRETGIPYMALYNTFFNEKKNRKIRGDELIAVSNFLEINPKDFYDEKEKMEKGV